MGAGIGLISGNSSNIQKYFVLDNKTILWVLVQTELSQAENTPHLTWSWNPEGIILECRVRRIPFWLWYHKLKIIQRAFPNVRGRNEAS